MNQILQLRASGLSVELKDNVLSLGIKFKKYKWVEREKVNEKSLIANRLQERERKVRTGAIPRTELPEDIEAALALQGTPGVTNKEIIVKLHKHGLAKNEIAARMNIRTAQVWNALNSAGLLNGGG